jgi:hypothetical protein
MASVEASAIWSSQSRTSLRPAWGFVSIGESIDTTSPVGPMLLGVLGSFAHYAERGIVLSDASNL